LIDKFGNKLGLDAIVRLVSAHSFIFRELQVHNELSKFENMIGTKIYAIMFAFLFNGRVPDSINMESEDAKIAIYYNDEFLGKYDQRKCHHTDLLYCIADYILSKAQNREYISEDLYFPATCTKRAN
jgi:hypothetical protein